jgi:hypothetical protein
VSVIVLGHLSENQKRAYMLADNKLALNAGWDTDMLRLELEALAEQDFNLDITGFDERGLRELIDAERRVLQDDAPAVQPTSVTEPGDLWRLGDHRLLCGDGTHSEEVERVLEGAQCDLIFADGCLSPKQNKWQTWPRNMPGGCAVLQLDSVGGTRLLLPWTVLRSVRGGIRLQLLDLPL